MKSSISLIEKIKAIQQIRGEDDFLIHQECEDVIAFIHQHDADTVASENRDNFTTENETSIGYEKFDSTAVRSETLIELLEAEKELMPIRERDRGYNDGLVVAQEIVRQNKIQRSEIRVNDDEILERIQEAADSVNGFTEIMMDAHLTEDMAKAILKVIHTYLRETKRESEKHPTEGKLEALLREKWKEINPSDKAQSIRAELSMKVDSGKYNQPDSDFMPDYVWDIADMAAQMALNITKRESGWRPIETAPCCVASSGKDNGRRPVIVTRKSKSPIPPIAIARLTSKGWICGLRDNPLFFEPTHWVPMPAPVPTEIEDGSANV